MESKLAMIASIITRKTYFFIFLIAGILYGLLYAVMTNLIDLRSGFRYINFSFTVTSITFFIIFSILGGLLIALQVYTIKNRQKSLKSANVGFLGTFLSFFNVTCPFCKPLLLSLIGFSGSLTFLKFGIALAFASVLLLLISIYLIAKNITDKK